MATAEVGFVAVSRAVVSYAAEVVAGVERRMVGDANVRTAQGNAWAAICADRARAQARADLDAMVAALAAREPHQRNAGRRRASKAANQRNTGQAGKGGKGGKNQLAVGSSPRSSASQAVRVSTR